MFSFPVFRQRFYSANRFAIVMSSFSPFKRTTAVPHFMRMRADGCAMWRFIFSGRFTVKLITFIEKLFSFRFSGNVDQFHAVHRFFYDSLDSTLKSNEIQLNVENRAHSYKKKRIVLCVAFSVSFPWRLMADSEESEAHTHKVSEREKRKNLRPMKHRFHSRKHSSQTQDRLYSNEQIVLSLFHWVQRK